MSKRDDLIKYITQLVITYYEIPKKARKERKVQKHKEHWAVRWFGVMPFSMRMTAGQIGQASKPLKQVVVRVTDKMRRNKWTKTT